MADEESLGDEVGAWTEIKLEIVRKYASAWSKIVAGQRAQFRRVYIDGFAGAGKHRSKATGGAIEGSPKIALEMQPPFHELHFIDLRKDKTEVLRKLCEGKPAHVYTDDANHVLPNVIFPKCRYDQYVRALCLIDPYGLHVHWRVLEAAAKTKVVEVVYHLSIMDINRNVRRGSPDRIPPEEAARMTAAWGDESWKPVLFETTRGLFGEMEELRDYNEVAKAFKTRLKDVAGFTCVVEPLLLKNRQNAPLYWLFFAGPNETGAKIARDIFKNHR